MKEINFSRDNRQIKLGNSRTPITCHGSCYTKFDLCPGDKCFSLTDGKSRVCKTLYLGRQLMVGAGKNLSLTIVYIDMYR